MQERLTVVRPPDVGRQLDAAVRAVCSTDVDLDPAALPLIAARLACGDFEYVRDLLRDAPASIALPLALARYIRWTGDLPTAAAAWQAVHDALAPLAQHPDAALRHATFLELAATATDLGDARLAARLTGLARALQTPPAEPPADAAAAFIHYIAFDVLGLDPDAARGRLRIRPRTDRTLDVRHIRFGDAGIAIRIETGTRDVTVRLTQDTGSIPVTVLLEPVVARANAFEVDGRVADLTPRPADRGVIVPVQLVLDDDRTLRIDTAGPA